MASLSEKRPTASGNVASGHFEVMDGAERAMTDILTSVRRPDGYCMCTVDFSYAEAFRLERVARTGVAITLIDMTLRAMAIAAEKSEMTHVLVNGYQRYRSDTVDIGCLVAVGRKAASVIVFRNPYQLSLEEIHEQRLAMIEDARLNQEKHIADLGRMTRFLPDRLRRRLIQHYVSQPHNRQKLGGTIQLSAIGLDDLDWMCPSHIGGALVLSLGGIKERPLVVDGQVVPRLCAHVTFMIDQRVVHPMRAMLIFRKFRNLIENPERLVK